MSGVQCMAQLAVEVGRCGSQGAVRGTLGTGLRDRRARAVCGALLLDAVGTCCPARVALLWCEPRFPARKRHFAAIVGRAQGDSAL